MKKFLSLVATAALAVAATSALAQQGGASADTGVRSSVLNNNDTHNQPTNPPHTPGLVAGVERAADATGAGIEKGARATGHAIKRGAAATGRGLKKGVNATGHGLQRAGRGISNAAESTGGTGTGTTVDANASVDASAPR